MSRGLRFGDFWNISIELVGLTAGPFWGEGESAMETGSDASLDICLIYQVRQSSVIFSKVTVTEGVLWPDHFGQ
jgi:hypothetical protein